MQQPSNSGVAGTLDFGEMRDRGETGHSYRTGLRLVVSGFMRGPEKYRLLDLKRRRAQIRARRVLGLI
jgi:hypothetical protein